VTQLSNAATKHLAKYLFEAKASILNITGPSPSVAKFAEQWSLKIGPWWAFDEPDIRL